MLTTKFLKTLFFKATLLQHLITITKPYYII